MTKDRLEKMTIKELEVFLNEAVADIDYTSTDRSDVKRKMFERIKEVFAPAFDLNYSDYRHFDFSIPTKGFGISIKVGAKATGKTQQVTRLRSKHVVGIGKLKVDCIHSGYSMPCFKIKDQKNFLIEIDGDWSSSGNSIEVPKTSKMTFEKMKNPEYIMELIEANYKRVEEQNKRWNKTDRVYKNLKEEIAFNAAQPLLQQSWMGNEKKLIKALPKEYRTQIKNGETDWFEATIKLVMEKNVELIEQIQNDIINL